MDQESELILGRIINEEFYYDELYELGKKDPVKIIVTYLDGRIEYIDLKRIADIRDRLAKTRKFLGDKEYFDILGRRE